MSIHDTIVCLGVHVTHLEVLFLSWLFPTPKFDYTRKALCAIICLWDSNASQPDRLIPILNFSQELKFLF